MPHYLVALKRDGKLSVPTEAERFWAKVNKTAGCWLWLGSIAGKGYGRFHLAGGSVAAHRWMYESEVGPIPEGMQIDHICYRHDCVNPDHLQLVTGHLNQQNKPGAYRNSRSGVRGVGFNRRTGRWVAHARVNGKRYNGGTYDTIADAEIAARELRLRLMTNNLLDRR